MKFSVLTYNLLVNHALDELQHVLANSKPDILCFQEINTDEQNLKKIEKLGYRLADFSNSFLRFGRAYGVATFYNPQVFNLSRSQSLNLPSSVYQIITFIIKGKKNPRTVLRNEFTSKDKGAKITTYNIHLTPLYATNILRIKQIKNTFADLHIAQKNHLVIAGDFNFPYGRKKFEELIGVYGLKEATNNIMYTLEKRILGLFRIKLKLDYVLYKNLEVVSNDMIQFKHSDHYPILTVFKTPA
ncbi:hypothetical protein A3G67_01680 [Candidatus Roizmanbacteria bacterium RIFCSPLOWO2_12_FULL_40_12]|uniref:Endonuclease/exonuclease/phosphatase domain-containing protein n=1 Tax=Candidatus Roizmanbacteria bacterium RIFCSPLOWO2_01_FULL_40_42 TaxID=1802066 RepID=A0A1F7J3X4_9BACT|nr:MAG: hypothetical protein A2779_04000 [Candidatus Roizmanbacteria bacterium RIFCSPHIGHO2_01_FULL_40_98]OGK28749.1 MAG: hypothetical protein A3C31_02320 [Candidatus Roizmanbacteria bacterium RIFCSPHIGHO2_02_FULL_40_53]OGK30204.1 MAG: hypothetical protein A2W49_01275 [Candidatus Roizmanbacteria bacterium RIFCSPHIGHO2_12_41_18]OGK36660.1 MAG: hypothetical protein A3E69_01750 [Candidatus Roizmanbacteria bacterium RIFCSPHIGHO2_12_FULL_40_130]OGK50301.1 MAG: hypothetical protein A3B50_02935 [Candi